MRMTSSESSSIINRSTPWVDGCCGPMLMIIVSSSGSASGHMPPPDHDLLRARPRLELLRAFGRLAFEALLFERFFVAADLGHRGCGSPLNVTGTRADG